ncbi:TPA: helix-turn-helix transcriptional regulator [Escherichia coli]|nr:helix-turn-helix transcriptional regulator [Escherichia coli]HCN5387208.1 helix-turn-helix transcriptional regulator [Escherichia coli]HCO0590672.1 helix-turn-helix transcriptional regulator [Escherichia coli]HDZ7348403.1 helix-turn-helix transcriptional regulator [Escherichia coli]
MTINSMTINAIIHYIEDNIKNKNINIDNMVSYSGYSRTYLQLIFKKIVGIPLGKYIQLRRIIYAALLLRQTNLSLFAISELSHYDSQQTFTREFKKNTGYTPMQYRKLPVLHLISLVNYTHFSKIHPIPTICYMEEKKAHGMKISYVDKLAFFSSNSDSKWSVINSLFTKGIDCVTVSHKLKPVKKNNQNPCIDAIIWSEQYSSDTTLTLSKNMYAVFPFKGEREEYHKLIYLIHVLILPFYGFNRDDGYDLEKIKKTVDGDFFFLYHIPVTINNASINGTTMTRHLQLC